MRAFMSDAVAREREYPDPERAWLVSVWYERAEARAAAALHEAQALRMAIEPTVYAEGYTPDEYHGSSDMRVSVLTRDYAGYGVVVGALVDALAAFVADDETV